MTHAKLSDRIDALEQKRVAMFEKLTAYDHETLNRKPSAEAWSAIQTLEHMMTVEMAATSYVKKKALDKTSARKTGIKQWFRSLMLDSYLRSPKKFPAPSSVVPVLTQASLHEIRGQWDTVRLDMRNAIKDMPEELLSHGWFKHPAVGMLNFKQMLTFMEAHYDRHENQVWRTLQAMA
ncbi:MAG: DinB family protein [Bacteroidetes bacterium]|nr:DinB family protein [Bacteroidota bacterium]